MTDTPRPDMMRRSDDPAVMALEIVRTDMGRRFDGLDKRLDQMVTRDVHDSEVKRLDTVDAQLRRDLDDHETEARRRFNAIEQSVLSGDRAILSKIAEEHHERVKSRRWAIGAVIAAGGLGISSTALLLNYLT